MRSSASLATHATARRYRTTIGMNKRALLSQKHRRLLYITLSQQSMFSGG